MSETLDSARLRIEPVRGKLLKSDLPLDLKYKGLVQLAYEYVMVGHPAEAISLLAEVPDTYYKGVMATQMRQDVEFFQRASAVWRAFRDCGVLPFSFEPVPRASA